MYFLKVKKNRVKNIYYTTRQVLEYNMGMIKHISRGLSLWAKEAVTSHKPASLFFCIPFFQIFSSCHKKNGKTRLDALNHTGKPAFVSYCEKMT
jgi:hypothetical protein